MLRESGTSERSVMQAFVMVKMPRRVRRLSDEEAMANREVDSVFARWHTSSKGREREKRLRTA